MDKVDNDLELCLTQLVSINIIYKKEGKMVCIILMKNCLFGNLPELGSDRSGTVNLGSHAINNLKAELFKNN